LPPLTAAGAPNPPGLKRDRREQSSPLESNGMRRGGVY
jgi:hypothetical protein